MKPFRFIATPIATALAIAFAATGIAHSAPLVDMDDIKAAGGMIACMNLATKAGSESLSDMHYTQAMEYREANKMTDEGYLMAIGYSVAIMELVEMGGSSALENYVQLCMPGKAEHG